MSDVARLRADALERWQRFWFAEIPPHVYALLRIIFGVLGLLGVLGLTPVSTFWSLSGIAYFSGSLEEVKAALLAWNLGTAAGATLFTALVLFFVCMTVGYLTRAAVVTCFLGTVFQLHWNPLPLTGGSQVVSATLFSLIWVESGAVWSVDAWLRARANAQSALTTGLQQPVWPLYLLRVQIAVVYLSSGLWKFVFGQVWRDGSAIYFVLQQNVFSRLPVPSPPALDPLLTAMAYFTLFWELSFPLMLLNRWTRRFALVTGIALHLGMWLTMEIGLFSWIMIGSYAAFLDPERASKFFRVGNCAQAGKDVRTPVGLSSQPNQA